MKAIMYHYVRKYDPSHPNFRFLDLDNFRKQLDYFSNRFDFIRQKEWDHFIHTGEFKNNLNKIILTFDDAMSCHFKYVFPELMKRNIMGIFYVSTLPIRDQKILDVHKIHLLCGAFDGKLLLNKLTTLLSSQMISDSKIEEFQREYSLQTNSEGVSEFKKILNYYISYTYRSEIINKLAKILDYTFESKNFYVSPHDLQIMKKNGMIIGSHGHSHLLMSKLSKEEQKIELEKSFEILEETVGLSDKTYCHPYGGFHSFNEETVMLLNELDVRYSFNVEPRDIELEDAFNSRQFLPRYDCNLFDFGGAS